jgi:hypothetical protein
MSRQRRGFYFVSEVKGSNRRFDSEEAGVKFTFKTATKIYIVARPQEPIINTLRKQGVFALRINY